MKQPFALSAAFLIILLAGLAACTKNDPPPPLPSASVSWLVDGDRVTVLPVKGYVTGNTVTFAASSTAGGIYKDVSFDKLPRVAGTYAILSTATPNYAGPAGYCAYDNRTYGATSGTITIATIDAASMSGTFAFTATHFFSSATKTVTDGQFTVNF